MAGPTTLFQTGIHASRPAATAGCVLYSCTTHSLVYRSDGSAWTTWMTIPAGASMATDTIWDAAGDLAVGTGADTAAKLTIGAAGGALSRVNGAVAWNSGTSFPTAATGDRYWRTDLGMEFYYDGTRWLSTQLGQIIVGQSDVLNGYTTGPGTQRAPVPVWAGSDIWLVATHTWFFVNAGTALSASHKWVGTLIKQPAGTTLDTVNIDSGASSTFRQSADTALGAALATTQFVFQMSWAKTGTPGPLFTETMISFRYVAT